MVDFALDSCWISCLATKRTHKKAIRENEKVKRRRKRKKEGKRGRKERGHEKKPLKGPVHPRKLRSLWKKEPRVQWRKA